MDHEAHRVYVEEIQMIPLDQGIEVMRPTDDTIASRLSAPIVSFDVDTNKISFERYTLVYDDVEKYKFLTCFIEIKVVFGVGGKINQK